MHIYSLSIKYILLKWGVFNEDRTETSHNWDDLQLKANQISFKTVAVNEDTLLSVFLGWSIKFEINARTDSKDNKIIL